jgi:hypothetical protein
MKNKILLVLVVVLAVFGIDRLRGAAADHPAAPVAGAPATSAESSASLSRAIAQRASGVQVQGSGIVTKLLSDDNDGSRHQPFIVRLADGGTLLIAHNIDLAERVSPLSAGDTVSFSGEYEWNERGGVVHWTHDDPDGSHVGGWIRRDGASFH